MTTLTTRAAEMFSTGVGALRHPSRRSANALLRNGYLLTLSSGLTALVGVLYWTVAAWRYTPQSVGSNSAALSLMMFIASIAQLNMSGVMVRFIPSAGPRTRQLVATGYLICVVIATIAGAATVLAVRTISPNTDYLEHRADAILFVVSAVVYAVFVLQDGTLVGLRRAAIVPIENTVFALSKLVLVIGLAALMPWHGILASWTISLLVLILLVGIYLFRTAIPYHQQQSIGDAEPLPPIRHIARFVAADYIGSVCSIAAIDLMPIMVVSLLGNEQNAYFAIAWLIGYSVHLINVNMGTSLVADTAGDPTRLAQGVQRVLTHTVKLLVPVVLIIVITAPFILRVFGPGYESAANTLRLLTISAIPHLIVSTAVSSARAQRRLRLLIYVQVGQSALALGLTWLLLHGIGATGPGWAWLASQMVLASILLIRRREWLPQQGPADAAVSMWALAQMLRLLEITKLRRHANRLATWWRARAHNATTDVDFAAIDGLPAGLTAHSVPTVSDVEVLILSDRDNPAAVLKRSRSPQGAEELRTQRDILKLLRADHTLDTSWLDLLPQVLRVHTTSGITESVESYCPGIDLTTALRHDMRRADSLTVAGLVAIAPLHQGTATNIVIDDTCLLRLWVTEPIAELSLMCERIDPRLLPASHQLGTELRDTLLGHRVEVCWTHGDYTPGNIRLSDEFGPVTGILDWGGARPARLPLIDNYLLLLTVSAQLERSEIGTIVASRLRAGGLNQHERQALSSSQLILPHTADADLFQPDERTAVLLTWLHHATDLWRKCETYRNHRVWWVANVGPVLRAVADTTEPAFAPNPARRLVTR